MDYNESYMLTHDIDWFCRISGVYIHLASAGGILPVGFRDREKLRTLQYNVSIAPYQCDEDEIVYNEDFLIQRFADNAKGREAYLVSFREMAMKGFVSMDRTNLIDPYDYGYHWVYQPKNRNQLVFENLEIPELDNRELRMLILRSLN